MSDFIKTLGKSNQDALAIKFPVDCSNLLFEVPTWAIGIMFLRNIKMLLLCSSTTEQSVYHPI